MGYYPRTDISYNENGLLIEVAIPGLNVEHVKLEFTNSILLVLGEHKERNQHSKYTSKELYTGYFCREYIINTKIFNVNTIISKMVNGLLTITIPYKDSPHVSEVKTISINEE